MRSLGPSGFSQSPKDAALSIEVVVSLARLCHHHLLAADRAIDFAGEPQMVEEDGEFAGDGDDRTFLRVLAAFRFTQPPAAQVAIRTVLTQHIVGAVYEQLPEVDVAGFSDAQLRRALAGRPLTRHQPQVGADLPASPEPPGVVYGQGEGKGDERTNARHLLHHPGLRVSLGDQFFQSPVHGCDLYVQARDHLQKRCDRWAQLPRYVGRNLQRKAASVAPGQARPERFSEAAGAVDHAGSGSDQAPAAMDERQVRLRLLAAVLYAAQQNRVRPPQASECLGIDPVILLKAGGD